MEQNTTQVRLHALDGIRGLAILAVFINHLPIEYRYIPGLPSWVSLLATHVIIGNGLIGVSLLFLLSGFFMAYLYPAPRSNLKFIQKRYTRIFPLYLTMCAVNLVLTLFPHMQWYLSIGVIIVLALCTHFVWVHIVQRSNKMWLSRSLFVLFFMLQILVGFLYILMYVFHYQDFLHLPVMYEGVIGLVNATLTFPLGTSIPLLDGVYWTLAAEVLFYVLYPIICVPIVNFLIPKKREIKILVLLLLIPFFLFCYTMSQALLALSLFHFSLFYYFAAGITLGYLYRKNSTVLKKVDGFFHHKRYYLPVLLFTIVIVTEHILVDNFMSYREIIWMLYALPFTLLIAIALNHESFFAKILSSKSLVFIGIISYSIYLSHTPVIHIMRPLFNLRHLPGDFFYVLATFLVTTYLSCTLYYLLEKPYFIKKDVK